MLRQDRQHRGYVASFGWGEYLKHHMIQFACHHCKGMLEANEAAQGTLMQCPLCSKQFTVPEDTKHVPPQSVTTGGWLVFFGILTAATPIFTIGSMYWTWTGSKRAIEWFPVLRDATIWENMGASVLMIYGFFVGLAILHGSPKGKSVATHYLKFRLVVFLFFEGIQMLSLHEIWGKLPPKFWYRILLLVIKEMISFTVWWLYFKESKRVRRTYDPHFISDPVPPAHTPM